MSKFISSIPVNYDVSLAFIVVIMAVLAVYMGIRCVRRVNFPTVITFTAQLCLLTTGVLTIFNRVLVIPLYEIMMILLGILLPAAFLFSDYRRMKKRMQMGNADVPLIERVEKQSNKGWRYEDYIDQPHEWRGEIPDDAIVNALDLSDKSLKANVIQQLTEVHKLIGNRAYKQALDIYTILSGLLSENPLIVYNTAWLCHKNELFEEAVKHYKKVLLIIGEKPKSKTHKKNSPDDENGDIRSITHFGYGLSLYTMKKYELAVNQFDLAKKAVGELREAEINIARCYMAIGNIDDAKKHIKTALKDKDDNKLRYLLARLCYENNQEMEAKYQLETIVASDAEFTEAWALLGKLYRKNEDWQNVQVAYKKLIQLSPQDADSYYRLGVAQRQEERTEEALSSFKFATELMPDHSRALYSMASIYDAQGKTDKAIEYLNKSLAGNEKLEMAYNLLAEIYISSDKVKEAVYVYEESIREHPES